MYEMYSIYDIVNKVCGYTKVRHYMTEEHKKELRKSLQLKIFLAEKLMWEIENLTHKNYAKDPELTRLAREALDNYNTILNRRHWSVVGELKTKQNLKDEEE